MSRMRLALGVSAGLHATALSAVILLATALPPPDQPPPKGFEIAIGQPAAQLEPARPVEPLSETVPAVPPQAERPVAAVEVPAAAAPEVPVITAAAPRPRPAVRPKPPPKPVVRRPEPRPQLADLPPPAPYAPAPASVPVPAPAPAPRADLAADYRAMLSGWFESHKRYPNSARENAEQGSAIVHFRVDSTGHIVNFGLAQSTGHADLDQGIADMMRGARLPAFPPGLTLSHLDVAVTLRFSLPR